MAVSRTENVWTDRLILEPVPPDLRRGLKFNRGVRPLKKQIRRRGDCVSGHAAQTYVLSLSRLNIDLPGPPDKLDALLTVMFPAFSLR